MTRPNSHHSRPKWSFKEAFSGDIDLTSGNLFGKMALYTFPIILLSLLQLLYSSADEIVVSYFGGGYASMNAIGSNSALINLVIGLFVGTSVGANVVVAKAFGEKDQAKAQKALESSMVLSVLFGVIIGVIGFFVARYLLIAMQTPALFLDKATSYLEIYFIGMPFLLVFNFGSAILRALGDSKRPLYALIACGAINVGLNFLFVMAFNLDVVGVGLTTLISEILEAILVVIFLASKRQKFIRFSFKGLRLYKEETLEILKHGIPAGLQSFVFSIANVFIQASVNSYSDASITSEVAMTGNTASQQVEGYIFIFLDAFSVATTAVVAQNYGAKKKENVRKAIWYGLFYVLVVGFAVGGICALFRNELNGIFIPKESFTSNGVFDQEGYEKSLDVAGQRLIMMGLTYCLDGVMEVLSCDCRGLGHPKTPTFVIFLFVTCLRLAFIFGLWANIPAIHTLPWLWSTWPISWVMAIFVFSFIVPKFYKDAAKKMDAALLEETKKNEAAIPENK